MYLLKLSLICGHFSVETKLSHFLMKLEIPNIKLNKCTITQDTENADVFLRLSESKKNLLTLKPNH